MYQHLKLDEIRLYPCCWLCSLRQGFDIVKNKILYDVDSSIGLLTAIRNILRTKDKGLIFLGIPCSSFSFMSSSQHKRSSTQPFGDEDYDWVTLGTRVAYRSALLIIIAIIRNVMWCVENPPNSTIIHLPIFRALFDYKTVTCQQIRWWGAQFGTDWLWVTNIIYKYHFIIGCSNCKLRWFSVVVRWMGAYGSWSWKPQIGFGNVPAS